MKSKKSPKALLNILAELSGSDAVIPCNKIDAQMIAEAEGGRDPRPLEPRHEFEHCDATGKVCYPSHNVAHQIMRRRQQAGAQRLRVYQCDSCHKYHLTSYA